MWVTSSPKIHKVCNETDRSSLPASLSKLCTANVHGQVSSHVGAKKLRPQKVKKNGFRWGWTKVMKGK